MTIHLENLVSEFSLDGKGLQAGATAITAGIGAVTAAAGLAMKATFDWAGEIDGLGDVMGGTNEELASLAFVARKSGVGTDVLTKGLTILGKGLVKADGDLDTVGKKLEDFGIKVLDSNGNVRDQSELMRDISNKYSTFSTQQEKVNFLTKTFGKSGADLIDFFDTMAQEGGIDKVSEKVKAFGLAIDPARYEQFTRSIEEIKLMALGLAVSFTEKVMPSLEKFVGWVSTKSVEGVEAFKKGGWSGLAEWVVGELDKLDLAFSKKIDSLPWTRWGDEFGDSLEKMLTFGAEHAEDNFLPRFVISFTDGMDEAIRAAGQNTSTPISWGEYWRLFFDNVHRTGDPPLRTFMINWEISWTNGIRTFMNNVEQSATNSIRTFFTNWEVSWTNGFIGVFNIAIDWLNRLESLFGGSWTLPSLPELNPIGQSVGETNTTAHASKKTGKVSHGGRATGGAVFAGGTWGIHELGKPETFTPFTAGRVDPVKPVEAFIDENRLATVLARVFGEQLQKRMA